MKLKTAFTNPELVYRGDSSKGFVLRERLQLSRR